MYENVVVSPEEAAEKINPSSCVEKQIDRVKEFCSDLEKYGYTITSMLEGIVESTLLKKELSFSVGIEYQGELLLQDKETYSWRRQQLEKSEMQKGTYDLIKQCFLEQNGLKNSKSEEWCRCIGGVPQTEVMGSAGQIYVYYFMSLNDEKIDLTFLHCAEEVYYEWCLSQLSAVFYAVSPKEIIKEMDQGAVKKQFHRNIAFNFNSYMRDLFSIEPEIITAISGIYYEGETCCSKPSFCLTDIMDEETLEGVTLDCPITVETQKIKRIRKLLQMGKEGQCLLICRSNQKWQVRGVYTEKDLYEKSFNFQIIKHMVWKMMVGGKLAVCFENGNYVIKSQEFELCKVKEIYEALFSMVFGENIENVCREAINQKHGTTLVILKENQEDSPKFTVEQEVERLILESSGMKMKPKVLAEGFVNSVTSIDGALIVDSLGTCYGFGMILDGPKKCMKDENGEIQEEKNSVQGNPDCGARHNSAMRYIKRCRDSGFLAMAIVVSEDGPVTVFTTKDDDKGGEGDEQ